MGHGTAYKYLGSGVLISQRKSCLPSKHFTTPPSALRKQQPLGPRYLDSHLGYDDPAQISAQIQDCRELGWGADPRMPAAKRLPKPTSRRYGFDLFGSDCHSPAPSCRFALKLTSGDLSD